MAWYDITDWYEPDDKFGKLDPRTVAQLQRAWGDEFTESTAEFWESITDRFPEVRGDREAMKQVMQGLFYKPGEGQTTELKRREDRMNDWFEEKYGFELKPLLTEQEWEMLRQHYEEQRGR